MVVRKQQRRPLLLRPFVIVAVVFAAGAGALVGRDEPRRAHAPAEVDATGRSVAGFVRYASDDDPRFADLALSARRNRYVVLNVYERAKLKALKAANPRLKVLVYKNLGAISSSSRDGKDPAGGGYAQADRQHPEGCLTNTSGERFTF